MTPDADADADAVQVAVDGATYTIVLPDRDSDYIQGWVSAQGRPYEHPMLSDMARRLARDDVVLDVGANVGNHTIYLAAVVGCRVEAFEPDPTLTTAIRRSVDANGLGGSVTVHTVALGAGVTTGTLVRPDETNIGSQHVELGAGDVAVAPLDGLDVRRPVRAIKVDVEGMELDVLEGAAELIQEDRPVLYVECATQASFAAVAAWLDGRGFSYWDTFNATPTHLFVPAESLTAEQLSRRLLLKAVRDGYRADAALDELRGRLDAANRLYRSSTEAYDAVKREVDRARADRARAEDVSARELADAHDERARLEGRLAALTELVAERNHQLEVVRQELDGALGAVERTAGAVGAATAAADELRLAAASARSERDAALQRGVEAAHQRDDLLVELRSLRDEADRSRAALGVSLEHLGAARAEAGQLEEQLRRVGEQLAATAAERDRAQASSGRTSREVSVLRQELTKQTGLLAATHRRVATATRAASDAERERDAAEDRLARWSQERAERAGELRALRDELSRSRAELVEVTARLRAQEGRLAELTSSVADAWAETGELTEVLAEHRATGETMVAELRATMAELTVQRDEALEEAAEWAVREQDARSAHEATALRERVALQREQAARAREKDAVDREARVRSQLRDVRSSATFRAGKEVRRASSSVPAALALPARLWSIAREPRPEKRVIQASTSAVDMPVLSSAAPAEPARTPAAPAPTVPPTVVVPPPPPVAAPSEPERDEPDLEKPAHEPPRRPARRLLRVAAIVDEFTGLSLAPDCELHHLTPADWEAQLQEAQPQLLFVESAWRGKDGTWHNTVGQFPTELKQIVEWCTARGVPTAFWNKEDPVHFATFLTTARAFDHVFTTDLDCIGRYKSALGHDRVYLLPFACQPRTHNPIESSPRKDAFAFAGSYYRRYPERTRDLDSFLEHLPKFRPVEIYDRNFGSDHEDYTFPDAYRGYVIGTLPPEDIARAYKGYRFGINLNSVKQSQTMFARRIFELLASNTITVSNFSRGVRLLFGDLVLTTDSGADAVRRLNELGQDDDRLDRLRLAALRSVMSQHTYADRLAYVVAKLTGVAPPALPDVVLVGHASTSGECEQLIEHVRRQQGVRVRGVLLVEADVEQRYEPGITFVRSDVMSSAVAAEVVGVAGFVGVLHPDDYYGPHYAVDLALGSRYSDADVFGKQTRYRLEGDDLHMLDRGAEYRRAGRLPVRASLLRAAKLGDVTLGELAASAADGVQAAGLDQLSLDRFGYCEDGARKPGGVTAVVDDLELGAGTPIAQLQALAEAAPPAKAPGEGLPTVEPDQLARWFAERRRPSITHHIDDAGWHLESTLEDGTHDYLYASDTVSVADLWSGPFAEAHVATTPGLRLQLVFVFLDADGQRLSNFFALAQQNARAEIPPGAVRAKVAVRLLGPGRATVRRVVLGRVPTEPDAVVATSRDLVLTNHYPSYDNLYRNGFVHSRVRAYRRHGVRPDVFRLRDDRALEFSEFEGVDVATGSRGALSRLLAGVEHRSVMVHFLDRPMWSVLSQLDTGIRVVVWLHGAEVQPWWRRSFNYRTDDEVDRAKAASEERVGFWREVFENAPTNVHFAFVSQYLADAAMEDTGVRLDAERYSIVHNPIDETLFTYSAKEPEQRLRILSLRPFATPMYANDLTVAAIQRLRREPWFAELEFRIVGDGPLFEDTVAPLRGLANVTLERGFVSQHEIAAMHKVYGVFLVPTRWDSHGVSRDEAMSSGLVPVSCAVAAVPEFVDEESGILVPPDDADALAQAISRLRASPELFRSLSCGAAARVRAQSGGERVISQELRLIGAVDHLSG